MKIQLQAKGKGQERTYVVEVETPCEIWVEIGKRLMRMEVDAKGGARIVGDTGSPEDNEV